MSTVIEDLKKDKAANDQEITELKKDIKLFDDKIKAGEQLTPVQEKAYDGWRARLSELTQSNDKLNHEISELSKSSTASEEILGELKIIREGMTTLDEGMRKVNMSHREWELHRLDVWEDGTSSQGSGASGRKNNGPFKESLITFYDRQAGDHPVGDETLAQIRCMVLDKPIVTHKVCAAHLWKHSRADDMPLLGLSPSDIDNPRNGLLLAKSIEVAFDKKEVCFLYNPFDQKFHFCVLNPSLLPIRIYYPDPKIPNDNNFPDTFASLNNQPLQLPKGIFPYKRILGFHARCAFRKACPKWITEERYQEFLLQESLAWKFSRDSPWYSEGAVDPLTKYE